MRTISAASTARDRVFIAGLAAVEHRDWLGEMMRVKREQPALSRVEALATAMIETKDAMRE